MTEVSTVDPREEWITDLRRRRTQAWNDSDKAWIALLRAERELNAARAAYLAVVERRTRIIEQLADIESHQ